ncbi:NAD(P)H-dependent oxidoreductase [Kribbella flavida]|uniref:NAD(P)H-dependent oxidoreductase n=1 Tax=Kribbella flavida TaxID=182640 RepID=UPI001ED8E351|nr:NAD(P)H-dependent oxidoreductase [Kribbella flavida]
MLVLVAHPREGSFNHALTQRMVATLERRGLDVTVHDLYAEGFDPVLRAEEAYTSGQSAEQVLAASNDPLLAVHRRDLNAASALVVVHPNWWGKPPAILAGWMDRVLVPGVAYRLDEAGGEPTSLLSLREVLVINTSDTTRHRETELFGDPLESIWLRCLPPYLGGPRVERIVLRVVAEADAAERARWLDDAADRANRLLTSDTNAPSR